MPYSPNIDLINTDEGVTASVTNRPLNQLAQRTDWLLQAIQNLEAGTQLLLRGQVIDPILQAGAPVYYNNVTSRFEGALAAIDPTDLTRVADSAFWQGVLQTAGGTAADVVIGGAMTLSQAVWAAAFEDGVFAVGPVFLSSATSARLTTSPGSAGIYLGNMIDLGAGDAQLLVRQGNPGGFTEHVHLQRTMLGDPAGTVIDPVPGDPQVINTPDSGQPGWLPASVTYFPGFIVGVQIPTGAKFGYNLADPSETALAEIFPLVPPDNAQFEQSGLILNGDKVVANQYGIWWMDDTYGNAPWPVDYAATLVAEPITLWSTRLVASSSILELVSQSIITQLQNGDAALFAVTGIVSDDTTALGVSGTDGDGTDGFRGKVTIENLGVTALRLGRGLSAAAPLGDNTTGYKKLVDLTLAVDLPAAHMFTYLDAGDPSPSEKQQLLTTNGITGGGTPIGLYGHRLGPDSTDFIDFEISVGSDLPAGIQFQVTVAIHATVDTPVVAVTAGEVDVSFYRLIDGTGTSTATLQRTEQASFNEGFPGLLQRAVIGPFADVVVEANNVLIIRLTNASGLPLTPDTLRVLSLTYGMTEV